MPEFQSLMIAKTGMMPDNSICPTAWFFFRCFARFFGSMFFPFFRYWGETEHKPGRLFIARDFGLLTWLCVLRIFSRPVRFILYSPKENSLWLKLAKIGGLAPVTLSSNPEEAITDINSILDAKEVAVLLIPENIDQNILKVIETLKNNKLTLFMAVSGARSALPDHSIIAKVCEISVFCGMPCVEESQKSNILAELDLLENAVRHVPLNELPSIFFNRAKAPI